MWGGWGGGGGRGLVTGAGGGGGGGSYATLLQSFCSQHIYMYSEHGNWPPYTIIEHVKKQHTTTNHREESVTSKSCRTTSSRRSVSPAFHPQPPDSG